MRPASKRWKTGERRQIPTRPAARTWVVRLSQHGEGLARACLTVCKDLASVERRHKRGWKASGERVLGASKCERRLAFGLGHARKQQRPYR